MKRALVIGGTGFIGLNLVDELLRRGVEVRVTRRKRSITAFLRRRPVELVHAELEDLASLIEAMRGCDAVFLAAGHYPRYSLDLDASVEVAVRGVRNACQAALATDVERFVYTSSVASLGPTGDTGPANEDDIPRSRPTESVYRAVKWAMEREIELASARGLPAITILPGGCVGPWDVRLGTGSFIVGVVQGLLPWYLEGIVNIVDVADVARAHAQAAEARGGARYCVAGHCVYVSELLQLVEDRYGGRAPTDCLRVDEARQQADADERSAAERGERVPFPREMVDIIAAGQAVSSARAEEELGLRFTSLDDALDRAHDWFRRFGYLRRPIHRTPETHRSL